MAWRGINNLSDYPGGQVPTSVQYIPATNVTQASSPYISLRQSYGAPIYRDSSPHKTPVRCSDDGDLHRIQEELQFRFQPSLLHSMVITDYLIVDCFLYSHESGQPPRRDETCCHGSCERGCDAKKCRCNQDLSVRISCTNTWLDTLRGLRCLSTFCNCDQMVLAVRLWFIETKK
jgi:hypothetical protein